MTKKSILQLKNLTISVEHRDNSSSILVKNISFDILKGEIVGLVGESGSGKSLTSLACLRLLADKLSITEGEILFGDEEVNLLDLTDAEMQKIRGNQISMIFQEPMSSLNPLMKCGKQVEEMFVIHRNMNGSDMKAATISLFEKVQLPDPERAYNAFPSQLSGGQLQRIMIAMAIACNPSLIIADECTTALDVTVQKEIVLLLKSLNKELGISILFISHDLEVIADIADSVVVMRQGEIMEKASTQDIFTIAQNPYTQQLIASRPPIDFKLAKLPKPDFFKTNNTISDFYLANTINPSELSARKEKLHQSKPILEVKNLVKFFPQKLNFWGKPTAYVKAVNDVSFVVRKGETVGLVGESGCGKSTLSKALLRLIEPDSGEVLFEGNSLFGITNNALRKKRKDIQYIFQDPYSSLNPRHKIGFAIQEPMAVHQIFPSKNQRKERTIELLELVGLEADHYNRYPHQFSGGQRQRICIARALGLNPSFIVCDEIVSALDVSVQAQVLNLLVELRDNFDLSLLFVTHDLSIVKFISDRIIVMNQGNIEEMGWVDEVFDSPKSPYTRKLLEAIPGQHKKWEHDN